MRFEEALGGLSERSHGRTGGRFRIELAKQIRKLPVSYLPASRLKGLALDSTAIVDPVNMERAVAFVGSDLAAARPEELARPQMTPKWVGLVVSFHDVTLPQQAPNQWISSLAVRAEYTRAAALGDTMMVV